MIRRAIDSSGRSIVFSTSPGETPVADAAHVLSHANLWRVSDDFWDNWKSLDHEFTLAARWEKFVGPGHWPDADMLPVGHLSVAHRSVGADRLTALTRDEQLTHLSFWSLLPSPLMVGANLPDNDPWTLALLTNPEVLAVNQDALGAAAHPLTATNGLEIWVKPLRDGSQAVGIFNRGRATDFDEAGALFKSQLITRQTPGQSVDIDLDITGAKKLWLVVDDGGDGYDCDHADWLNPQTHRFRWRHRSHSNPLALRHRRLGQARSQPQRRRHCAECRRTGLCRRHRHAFHLDHRIHAATGLHALYGTGGTGPQRRFAVHARRVGAFSRLHARPARVHRQRPRHAGFSPAWPERRAAVRDLWLRKDLGRQKNFSAELPPHGCVLLRVN